METTRILVVEDDPSLLDMICVLLDSWGYETDRARSGAEALARIEAQCPDIVISDLVMPGSLNGIELLTAIRTHRQECVIFFILLTGYATVENAVDAIRRGADEVMIKPLDLDKFREFLGSYRSHHRRRLET